VAKTLGVEDVLRGWRNLDYAQAATLATRLGVCDPSYRIGLIHGITGMQVDNWVPDEALYDHAFRIGTEARRKMQELIGDV
jgi:hypothetical protein